MTVGKQTPMKADSDYVPSEESCQVVDLLPICIIEEKTFEIAVIGLHCELLG